jgi:hypothetical protein
MSLVMLDQLDMETIMNEFYNSQHNRHTGKLQLNNVSSKVVSIH